MQTLDLHEAAEFLKMNPEVLRRKAKAGLIKGSKPGKRTEDVPIVLVRGPASSYRLMTH